MSVSMRTTLAFTAAWLAIVNSTTAQLRFEDLPPSAQMRSMKPIPAPPPPIRPDQPIMLAPQAPVEGGIPNPYFADCVYYDDFGFFTPQPDEVGEPPMLVPLQDGLLGVRWETGRDFIGMANDALFTALGGSPPVGLTPNGDPVERYIAFARETLGEDPITTFSLGMNARTFGVLVTSFDAPVQTSQFVYIQSDDGVPDTSLWWSPTSFAEAFVVTRVFFGGVFDSGSLSGFTNENGVLDRFVTLGPFFDFVGDLYAHPVHPRFDVPTDEWFTIMMNLSQSPGGGLGFSVWVKSHQTSTAIPSFLDPRMVSGDIQPPDGNPNGWVDVFPGFLDDPETKDVTEGIGRATNPSGEVAPSSGAFGQSPILAAISVDGVQFGVGLDPESTVEPDYIPNDFFFGPACFDGNDFPLPCVIPAFRLPYMDSFEDYFAGQTIRAQTTRWFDEVESFAIISATQNTTPSGQYSLAQQNITNDNILRAMFGTALPQGATGAPGEPLVAAVNVRMNPTTRTGRMIVLNDDSQSGEQAAFIALGGTDPTGAFAQADAQIYVRQPNPDFEPLLPAQDHRVQPSWVNPLNWFTPPPTPLNLEHSLIPTGVALSPGSFHAIRIEIEPSTLDPDESPTMRVFFNEQELFPNGDPQQTWVAGSRTVGTFEFWSSANNNGQFDTIHVDDVAFDGPPRHVDPSPPFIAPYTEGFSSYQPAASIHGQGLTPFLNPESVPTEPVTQNEPQVTIVPSPTTVPNDGESVCRYELVEICLDVTCVLPPEESVIAMPISALPPLPNGAPLQCPTLVSTPLLMVRPFEVRNPMSGDRIGVGRWALVESGPVPFDAGAGDVVGFEFYFTNEPVWRVAVPRNQGLIASDPAEGVNQILRIENPGGVTDADIQSDLVESIDALLPEVVAAPEDFPAAQMINELAFDLYIESVDVDGNGVVAPPRSRLALSVDSSGSDSGRIAEFVFGGPNVPGGIAPENISYLNAIGEYVDTGVSLIAPSGGLSGPLVNTWMRIIFTSDHDGDWTISIDEDRDGPAAPIQIAQGGAVDAAAQPALSLTGLNSLQLRQGLDYEGGGQPITAPRRVRLKPGGAMAVGPIDADPKNDYCFYEISHETLINTTDPPQIAEVQNTLDGFVTGIRDLTEGDVIAVLNRRTNPDNTVEGQPLVHERCPTLPFDEIERFELLGEAGATIAYKGRWKSMGLAGEPGLALPEPAGGLTRPYGPIQDPPVSYNDPTAEPPGYLGAVVAREILLADWAMDADNGAAPSEPPLPASRWYVDNLSLRSLAVGSPCADLAGDSGLVDGADLAFLLAAWGAAPGSAADFNGDGFVNGDDLATLLANWGPCPE